MKIKRIVLTLGLLAVLGAGGFAAAKLIGGAAGTEAERPGQVDFDTIERRQATETAQPRFVGELLGIFIGPTEDTWPKDLQDEASQRLAGGCVDVPRSEAKSLDFPRPVALPKEYSPEELVPARVCSGQVAGLTWGYTVSGVEGIPGHVQISRSIGKARTYDVASDRVSVEHFGGREAIFIRPITPDGLAQIAYVLFPEPFGVTGVQTFNLSEADTTAVAQAVAEASK
jgi:hypothetical protein